MFSIGVKLPVVGLNVKGGGSYGRVEDAFHER